MSKSNQSKSWREKVHEIIYEADTPAGKLFDVLLLIVILISILLVMLESVESIEAEYSAILNTSEWVITILFSLEYIVRIIIVKKPRAYIFSFYGIIDLLSTIPKYLSLFFVGTHSLIALRALRLMRVFRILKLTRFIGETANFGKALKRSRVKIAVFLSFVIVLCVILGTVMYLVESEQDSGFSSIPRSVYWAVVTLTTVGYGDIAPITALGQFIASLIMILGYGIIAIPTGIVTSEMTKTEEKLIPHNTQACSNCNETYHQDDAEYCHKCGYKIHDE
ncbi:potassium voltage-gated channel subfamily KQT [Formosa sp. Hel1_33_131]|uniref:ion transporter n=1 Tax=Formosa sp. Hel1_33_131 TaxID=1336794 RepID=UPI00084E30B2|nr:ion transporter [Formosa sp. Hel1_33_131]AOR29193.1 potassium voltage-gated channel subfamily KQT [Formosa sp. Hel1_33_131]